MRRLLSLSPLVGMLACSSGQGSALRVTLDFSASTARCAKVVVTGRTAVQTNALTRSDTPRVIGVAPTYALGNPVTVEGFGWATSDCSGALVGAAAPQDVSFPAEGVTEVALRLEDFGNDGGTGGGAGGGGGGAGGGAGGGGGSDGGSDGGTDAGTVDAGRVEFPYTPSNFNPTISPQDTAGNIVLNCGTSSYDSKTNAFTNWCGQATPTPFVMGQLFGDNVVVLPMRGFIVASTATLKITGDKPVILAVYGDADVQGLIDADAEREVAGPGGSTQINCGLSTGSSGTFLAGAGGGGAGHLNAGSVGGYGPNQPFSFGIGGAASVGTLPSPLRGGCSGGAGGIRAAADTQAPAGAGGGGVQLSVAGTLKVSGIVSAAGGGGRGGKARKAGGAGGGSGGAILLEGQVINLLGNALLLTNGGAGGGGADDNNDGEDGENGRNDSTSQAQGGQEGGGEGGKGGDGESSQGADTQGEDASGLNGGGGGGGASAGRVHLRGVGSCSKASGVLISPSFTGTCP